MRKLYVYQQTLGWNGEPYLHITLSERPPKQFTLSEPVVCLGTLDVLPLTETEDGMSGEYPNNNDQQPARAESEVQ